MCSNDRCIVSPTYHTFSLRLLSGRQAADSSVEGFQIVFVEIIVLLQNTRQCRRRRTMALGLGLFFGAKDIVNGIETHDCSKRGTLVLSSNRIDCIHRHHDTAAATSWLAIKNRISGSRDRFSIDDSSAIECPLDVSHALGYKIDGYADVEQRAIKTPLQ